MRKRLLLAVSLAAFTLIPAVSVKAGKPVSCGSDVTSLTVTIDGSPTSSSGYNVTSDGQGVYQSSKKISLGFQVSNCTYDLVMDLSGSGRTINVTNLPVGIIPSGTTTSWFFNFDRIASVPITDGGTTFWNWCNGGVQTQNGSIAVVNGLRQDVYAPCGSDSGGAFARRNVGFGLANNYNLRFQNSPIDGGQNATITAFIKVYHPNATTWILEPDNEAYTLPDVTTITGTGELSALIYSPNGATSSKVGDSIIMPFKITVTKP